MNVVWHEFKKIWNIKILIVIVLLCGVLFYDSFNNVRNYPGPSGNSYIETVNFKVELTERYGTSVSPEEMEAFLAETYEALMVEVEEHIQNNPMFAQMGVYSYLDFVKWRELFFNLDPEERTDAEREFSRILFSKKHDRIAYRIQALDSIRASWDFAAHHLERLLSQELFEWERQFFMDVKATDDLNAFIIQTREPLLAEADIHIARLPIFAENGITSYEEIFLPTGVYNMWEARTQQQMRQVITGQQSNFAGGKLRLLQDLERMAAYPPEIAQGWASNRLESLEKRVFNDRERQRLIEVLENREYLNVMNSDGFRNAMGYFNSVIFLILLATLILILPLLVIDRMRKVHNLQYTSKIGRQVMFRQLVAVLLSSVVLTTIMLAVFGGFYSTTGIFMFWNHGLVSFSLHGPITLFEVTFGQYMLIIAAITYILSLGTALIAFVISRFSRNLITAVIKGIPVIVALSYLCRSIFGFIGTEPPFTIYNGDIAFHNIYSTLYGSTGIAGIEFFVCTVLLLFAFAVAWYISKRERHLDVS